MEHQTNTLALALSIVQRGYGSRISDFFSENQIRLHWQCAGRGTASSETLDLLGIGSSEKDIVISMGQRGNIEQALSKLFDSNVKLGAGRGIGCILPLNAVSNLIAQADQILAKPLEKKGVSYMDAEVKNSLILITVNQGYSDEVMNTAKHAGATGGTVIRARWSGAEHLEQVYSITLQPEKEIIAILADNKVRNEIMDQVNREHGLKTEAHAVLCAIPVDRAFRLG